MKLRQQRAPSSGARSRGLQSIAIYRKHPRRRRVADAARAPRWARTDWPAMMSCSAPLGLWYHLRLFCSPHRPLERRSRVIGDIAPVCLTFSRCPACTGLPQRPGDPELHSASEGEFILYSSITRSCPSVFLDRVNDARSAFRHRTYIRPTRCRCKHTFACRIRTSVITRRDSSPFTSRWWMRNFSCGPVVMSQSVSIARDDFLDNLFPVQGFADSSQEFMHSMSQGCTTIVLAVIDALADTLVASSDGKALSK